MVLLALLLIAGCLIGMPLVTIWSLNTLFGTAIEFNFFTWFACVWLLTMLSWHTARPPKKS